MVGGSWRAGRTVGVEVCVLMAGLPGFTQGTDTDQIRVGLMEERNCPWFLPSKRVVVQKVLVSRFIA